jgi:hypothetical protein
MDFKKYKPISQLSLLAIILCLVHKTIFVLNNNNPSINDFLFPVEFVYGFFYVCSFIVLLIIIIVGKNNIDNVGYTFLLITVIKMAISFALMSFLLDGKSPNYRTEKISFFIVFCVFLTIETILTAKILNNKQ